MVRRLSSRIKQLFCSSRESRGIEAGSREEEGGREGRRERERGREGGMQGELGVEDKLEVRDRRFCCVVLC